MFYQKNKAKKLKFCRFFAHPLSFCLSLYIVAPHVMEIRHTFRIVCKKTLYMIRLGQPTDARNFLAGAKMFKYLVVGYVCVFARHKTVNNKSRKRGGAMFFNIYFTEQNFHPFFHSPFCQTAHSV